MNHVYRVIWNGSAACWQAVSETARGRSKSSKSTAKVLKPLLVAASMAASGLALAAPTGGTVASGTASIGVSGSTTTINQSTAKAVINWNDFSIANGETVNFVQPDANAIALNRVTSATASSIQGALNANGQVFIVNPNGITFGSTAQVNVGGLVASTLDISDTDFNNGTYRFANSSNNSSISNQGAITVANTGTAALIAPSIQQAGSIVNNDGTILLTAASDVTLSLSNRVLNSQTINAGHNSATINNSAGTLQADGGKVILTAQGINASSTASISSAGTIRAQTLAGNDRGAIDLIADYTSGTVNLSGTLDASAPTNGFGGTIRTFGADVAVSNTASVSTRKVSQTSLPGTSSVWQIRANSITVGSGGTISGSKLSSSLNDGSVSLTALGTGSGQGNTTVNDAVSSSANVILSLSAAKDININNNISLSGSLGRLVMNYNTTNDYYLNNGSKINLSGSGATLRINSTDYTVINSLGVAGDTSTTTLQGMKNNLTGNYVLGSDIDASATSGWNSGKGFDPIANGNSIDQATPGWEPLAEAAFVGNFHGLGNSIDNLYINRPTESFIGLFGVLSSAAIRDINLTDVSITGSGSVGALAGVNVAINKMTNVSNINVSGSLFADSGVGGLIGLNLASSGTANIINSNASVNISAESYAGGLVSENSADYYGVVNIVKSHSSGSIIGSANESEYSISYLGGLVGINSGYGGVANIISSTSSMSITGYTDVSGGLVGGNYSGVGGHANIMNSSATGEVSVIGSKVGGLVGQNSSSGTGEVYINSSYASGPVTGVDQVGGLIGENYASNAGNIIVVDSYAIGNAIGNSSVGGLIGRNQVEYENNNILIDKSYATGLVAGAEILSTGGLVGVFSDLNSTPSNNGTSVNNSYWDTTTSGQSTSAGGTGKTTAELKQIATFSGWDIADVSNTTSSSTWVIDQNNSTPWLR